MNFLKLVYLNLKLTCLRILQQIKILPCYIQEPLWKIDLLYLLAYSGRNPYKICKDYFKNLNEDNLYTYGETWPSTVPKLVQYLPVTAQDVLYDLGSGTGRISFWFQKISGCKVVAIEKVPFFVQTAKKVQEKLKMDRITFLNQDILEIDYSPATLIYFYGTSFSDEFIYKLLKKWETLRPGTRILTTSFHLNEYLLKKEYTVIQEYKVSYPWGNCDVYLQEKN